RSASAREHTPNFDSARARERGPRGWAGAGGGIALPRAVGEGEGHLALAHDVAVDTRDAAQRPHPRPQAHDRRLQHHRVPRHDRPAVTHAIDAHEIDEAGAVLRLGEDQHRPRLGHGFREDGRGQGGPAAGTGDEVALVGGHVLHRQAAAVRLQLQHPVEQEEGIAVRQHRLDVLDLHGQLERAHRARHGPSRIMATSLYVLPSSVLRSPESAEKTPALPGALLSELLPIVGEIGSVLDPDALLPTIARQLRRVVDYKLLDIFLPEKDGSLTPAFVDGYPPETAAKLRIRPGEGIVGAAARTREPIFVPDVSKDRRYLPLVPGVVAEMAIPLLNRDHLVGVLNIEGPDPRAFTPDARTALQVLARHLAIAIENAPFYRETRWYAVLLATLYEIGKETASILDLDELLQRVAEVVKRVIDYEMFGILLIDEATNELVVRKAVAYAVAPQKPRIKVGEGLTGTAAATKQPILVGDVRQDPRYLNLIPHTRSELVVPLIHKEKVLGVFDLASPELNRFTEEHVKVLTLLASQVAVAIENARLYEALREKEERLEKDLDVARRIQGGLFPEKCPSGPGWEASAHFVPAQVVGGDLYDFYDLGERMLGLAVADVAGKGVSAALYGAFASGN